MLRAMDKWMPGYLRSVARRQRSNGLRHLIFCVADHFEPFRGDASEEQAARRVSQWEDSYAGRVAGLLDSDGVSPQHTFFYPEEEYSPAILNRLTSLCAAGHGEVEVHLHHRNDTPESLRRKLISFRDTLRERHGLLGSDAAGNPVYAFIHGNWALCNSRPDGDWCGVNDELGILSSTGCYADLTMPSAPSPTQSRMVNAIYRASDTGRPRAHDKGEVVGVNGYALMVNGRGQGGETTDHGPPTTDYRLPTTDGGERGKGAANNDSSITNNSFLNNSLLLIQGPLALNWRRRKWGVLPRLENAELTGANPPTIQRLKLWMRQRVHVIGRSEWGFVKLHTHGCVSANRDMLLGEPMKRFHADMQAWCRENNIELHYVTTRELYNIARAAEDGHSGDPGQYRDYEIAPPPVREERER